MKYLIIDACLGGTPGWKHDVMQKSTQAEGWIFKEAHPSIPDQLTGRRIQYHPGTSRHFDWNPYWKVVDGIHEGVKFPIIKPE